VCTQAQARGRGAGPAGQRVPAAVGIWCEACNANIDQNPTHNRSKIDPKIGKVHRVEGGRARARLVLCAWCGPCRPCTCPRRCPSCRRGTGWRCTWTCTGHASCWWRLPTNKSGNIFGWVFFLIASGSPHVRCTPMGVHRACGEPGEIELTPIGLVLNGSRHVPSSVWAREHDGCGMHVPRCVGVLPAHGKGGNICRVGIFLDFVRRSGTTRTMHPPCGPSVRAGGQTKSD